MYLFAFFCIQLMKFIYYLCLVNGNCVFVGIQNTSLLINKLL